MLAALSKLSAFLNTQFQEDLVIKLKTFYFFCKLLREADERVHLMIQ